MAGPPPPPLSKGNGFGSAYPLGSNGFGSEFPDEFAPPAKPAARPPAAKLLVSPPLAELDLSGSLLTHDVCLILQARKPPVVAAPAAKKPAPAAASSAKAKAPATANTSEPLKFKFSAEDAEGRWEEAIPADMRAELGDGNWKLRLEGAERLTAWLDEGHASDIEAEIFFRFFSKVPGWSEKNFQVRSSCRASRRSVLTPSPHPLPGLVQDLQHDVPSCREVANLLQVLHRHRHRPPHREAG